MQKGLTAQRHFADQQLFPRVPSPGDPFLVSPSTALRIVVPAEAGVNVTRSPRSMTLAVSEPATTEPAPEGDRRDVGPRQAGALLWADLMRRTFGFDVLACPRCGGRMRLVALIEQARVASCGISACPPRSPSRVLRAPRRAWDTFPTFVGTMRSPPSTSAPDAAR